MAIVAAVLEGQIPEDDRNLLEDDLTKFKVLIREVDLRYTC